jgi:hypothetical protein
MSLVCHKDGFVWIGPRFLTASCNVSVSSIYVEGGGKSYTFNGSYSFNFSGSYAGIDSPLCVAFGEANYGPWWPDPFVSLGDDYYTWMQVYWNGTSWECHAKLGEWATFPSGDPSDLHSLELCGNPALTDWCSPVGTYDTLANNYQCDDCTYGSFTIS